MFLDSVIDKLISKKIKKIEYFIVKQKIDGNLQCFTYHILRNVLRISGHQYASQKKFCYWYGSLKFILLQTKSRNKNYCENW